MKLHQFIVHSLTMMAINILNILIYVLMLSNTSSYLFNQNYVISMKKELRRCRKYLQNVLAINVDSENPIQTITFKWRDPKLSMDMIETLTDQLGYSPRNIINIGKSELNNDGSINPLVAIVYPLNYNRINGKYREAEGLKPFPTIIWMTCPKLQKRVSSLEDDGWITKLYDRLHSNTVFLQQQRQAHENYKNFRWNLFSDTDKKYIAEHGWEEALNTVGIAGMKNYNAVKCLHTHYAHYLARPEDGNIIGQWVDELLHPTIS